MKRAVVITAVTALFGVGALTLSTHAESIKEDAQTRKESSQSVEQQKQSLTKLKINVDNDIRHGLDKVSEAIKTLDAGKPEDALKQLKEAVGSFDIALAADPTTNLVPVSSVVQQHELYTDVTTVKGQVSLAENLLEDGRVQEARLILMPLRSDVTETVTYLPMATYPAAIRAAVKEIANGEITKAKETLAVAMNTLVTADVKVVPIPLLAAQSLINEASKLDKEKKKDEIKGKLTRAKDQLELARVLGYQTKSSDQYKKIKEEIEKIEKEIMGKNKVEKLYSDLKASFIYWMDQVAKPFFPSGVKNESKKEG